MVKFVLYILEQLDVQDIPTLSRLKEKKFGVYSWENLVKKVRKISLRSIKEPVFYLTNMGFGYPFLCLQ